MQLSDYYTHNYTSRGPTGLCVMVVIPNFWHFLRINYNLNTVLFSICRMIMKEYGMSWLFLWRFFAASVRWNTSPSSSHAVNWNAARWNSSCSRSCPQCHLYLFHSALKKHKAFVLWTAGVLCNLYLFGLRNLWQLMFHISVASLSTFLTLTRKLQDRSSDCGVWGEKEPAATL